MQTDFSILLIDFLGFMYCSTSVNVCRAGIQSIYYILKCHFEIQVETNPPHYAAGCISNEPLQFFNSIGLENLLWLWSKPHTYEEIYLFH